MLEDNVVMLAKKRLEALKVLADDFIDFEDVMAIYYSIKGLTDLRYLSPNHLSAEAINELILVDNIASLTMRAVNPEASRVATDKGAELDKYMVISERELADLIFKEGGRFNNPDAVSVAMHRGIIDDVVNERAVYEAIEQREAATRHR